MGHRQLFCLDNSVATEDDVDIYRPRSLGAPGISYPSELRFDGLKFSEEIQGLRRTGEPKNEIEKSGLLGVVEGLGFVES